VSRRISTFSSIFSKFGEKPAKQDFFWEKCHLILVLLGFPAISADSFTAGTRYDVCTMFAGKITMFMGSERGLPA
jgi:hypothetical protein